MKTYTEITIRRFFTATDEKVEVDVAPQASIVVGPDADIVAATADLVATLNEATTEHVKLDALRPMTSEEVATYRKEEAEEDAAAFALLGRLGEALIKEDEADEEEESLRSAAAVLDPELPGK